MADCEIISASAMESRKKAQAAASRPALQIYRPPGLRSDSTRGAPPAPVQTSPVLSPSTTPLAAGPKQPSHEEKHKMQRRNGKANGPVDEVNNNSSRPSPPPSLLSQNIPPPPQYASKAPPMTSPPPPVCPPSNTSTGCTTVDQPPREEKRPRAASTLSEESQKSTVSSSIGSESKERTTKQKTPPVVKKKEEKRRQLTSQETLQAGVALRALSIQHCTDDLERLISSEFADEVSGAAVGQSLVLHAVETSPSSVRAVAKAAQLLKDSSSFPGLHRGFILGLSNYIATKDTMRQERFRSWLAVLSLSSDLFANVGDNEQGELVGAIFDIYAFLLRPPVLESVKIEELESLISTLLAIGYELERECPDKLAQLKDLIRDAFIDVSEPWARKMILLMLELSASGWKLPPEANEYYFHHTTN